ncbi:MAG: SpoIIE family protein phosphatase [Melioribacteraceae bacterium]|nr:SpoIIE family protein phosphatase [Melioribacteraceae bacterium]
MLTAIKKSLIKHKLKLIIATTILFVSISVINFIFIYSVTAQSNDECLWTHKFERKDSIRIIIEQVKEGGVTWQAGIRDGDLLLAIDGKRAINNFIATQILDKVQKGDYATYTIQRGDLVFDTPVLVKKLINIPGLAFFLLSSLWLIVGFIVIIVKPNGRSQTLFYRIGLMLVFISSSSMLYRGFVVDNPLFRSAFFPILIDNVSQFASIFLPFMLFKFFSIFPKDFSYVSKPWFQRKIYLFPLLISIIVLAIKIFLVYIKRIDSVYLSLNLYTGIFNGFGFLLGFVLLLIGYLKLKTKQERIPIFLILVAYLVGVLALLYTNFLAPSIGGLIFNNPAYFTPIILIALLPIAFGYSIFRYSLMDVSEIVRNTIIYGTATASLAGIYFLIIYFVGQKVGAAFSDEYQGIIAGVIFVLFAVVFQSTKDRFQELLTEKFYPEQFAFQKNLLKFSNDISVIVGIDNILNTTEQLFVKSLHLHFFGIMLNNNGTEKIYSLVRHQGLGNSQLKIYDENSAIEKYFLYAISLGKKAVIERQDFKHLAEGRFSVLLDEEIYTVIPLIIKSKVIGLLLFGLKYSGSQFTAKDMELLIAAASQTAISIESARLYESELEKHKIERDLENARKIQESLLPKSFPQMPGLDLYGSMISAMQVGGDYYDLIKISDSKLFVVIGDVSGKGLSASIYMSKLQTMIRLYCTEERTPKEILVEINKMIYPDIEKNWFITISLALIDLDKKTIIISRAGHTPLLKINDDIFELYQPGGVGIGLNGGELFSSTLEEIKIEINPGDLLFLFSDGITELMNSENELYGIDNLKHFLTENKKLECTEIGKKLISNLESFRTKTHQYDDITFVILKIF